MRFVCTPVDTTAEPDNSGLPAKPKERIRMGTKLIPGRRPELVLGAGQKVKRGVGRRKMGGGSASFEPCKGVGHPIFQPVVVGWVMILFDKV